MGELIPFPDPEKPESPALLEARELSDEDVALRLALVVEHEAEFSPYFGASDVERRNFMLNQHGTTEPSWSVKSEYEAIKAQERRLNRPHIRLARWIFKQFRDD